LNINLAISKFTLSLSVSLCSKQPRALLCRSSRKRNSNTRTRLIYLPTPLKQLSKGALAPSAASNALLQLQLQML
jgi:hypothetical protein